MTEQEWLACTNPRMMLVFLRNRASDRKLRLLACGACRSVWRLLSKASRRAVEFGEMLADGPVDETRRQAVLRGAIAAVCRFEGTAGECFMAADIAYRVAMNDGWYAAEWTLGNWPSLPDNLALVRDTIGNPFCTTSINPAWLTWNDGTVVKLVQGIYDDRAFDRLPILADALEEAGCDNSDILAHCRGPGPHVRGCWIVDLLLGKE